MKVWYGRDMRISCLHGISSLTIFLVFHSFYFLIHMDVLLWKDAKCYSLVIRDRFCLWKGFWMRSLKCWICFYSNVIHFIFIFLFVEKSNEKAVAWVWCSFHIHFYTYPRLILLIGLGIISSAKMNECRAKYIYEAGGVDMWFYWWYCVMLYLIFDYKVLRIGLVIYSHVSTVDRIYLNISEKVFWNVYIWWIVE
jgi:hypothetical protein